MKKRLILIPILLAGAAFAGWTALTNEHADLSVEAVMGDKPTIAEPKKTLLPTMKVAKAVGWKAGEAPVPAAGLAVQAFATGLDHPRWMLPLANGDVLVAESNSPPRKVGGVRGWVMRQLMGRGGADVPSPNRIILLRDADGDGVAEQRSVLISGLNSPFGMALAGEHLYIGNVDALVRVPFKPGQTKIDAKPEKIVDLPFDPPGHWTRNVVANADGSKLYVAVGSATNIADNGLDVEKGRAAIWEIDAETKDHRVFAYGLRNPVGMAWEPTSNALWTVVNERDMLGSDLAPDYLTHVELGGFYGWPYYYWHGYIDKRVEQPDDDQRQYLIRPDYALGPHTASLGLSFAKDAKLGTQFADGAFIGQHGSWNRRPFSGYKVIFVPFVKGQPAGKPIDVLTGFLDEKEQARGRPVGVVADRTGALLVADDVGNVIWRVSAKAPAVPVAAPAKPAS
ncbi:sorbosone dehydrogenase [Sphingomonas sp. DBB INV C78]|uniref:PQQ-dependent sugar dehydrogenase n=1 Tax=Sphingomonas sp. DBB INV C78 TaxID=3349434 RepID=UPI0036D2687B